MDIPLGVGWATCNWLKYADLGKTPIKYIKQTNTKWRKHIKHFADKVTTCRMKAPVHRHNAYHNYFFE